MNQPIELSGMAAAIGACFGLGVIVVSLALAYNVLRRPTVRDLNKELWERVLKL